MSIVYLGIHKILGRKVAIKMLNPVFAKHPQYRKRFKNEAILLSKLEHPNIVSIYDYVEKKGDFFLITEFIEGQTLDEHIELVSGPMPETRISKLMLQILDAIEYIHSKHIIHRDIKSSNFIITSENKVKLIDFGIAKSLSKNSMLLTKGDMKVGTTIFMSPQQVKGKILDRRSDIYSLGVTLFHTLTGQYPYDKDLSEYEIYNKIVTEAFPNPQNFYVGISDKMASIVTKATEKHPLRRFQSCEEFSMALLQNRGKVIKPTSLTLRTKIVEATDFKIKNKIFTGKFWENFILLMSALIFMTILVSGIYFLTKKDIRHVIAGEAVLLTGDSTNTKIIEKLYYGETVKVINKEHITSKNKMLKIQSLRNNVGYVFKKDIANSHTYKQINSIVADNNARKLIPAKYKLALRKYFIENGFLQKNYSKIKLYAEDKKSFEYNLIAFGDYNGNNENDFACVINGIEKDENILLIFFDNLNENLTVNLKEKIKIKTVSEGKIGGRWFIGNVAESVSKFGKEYKTRKYEYLENDGILLLKTETDENFIYLYNEEEKSLMFYSQKK